MLHALAQFWSWLKGRGKATPPGPRSAVVGRWGEDLAVRHLKKAGFTILGRNVRPNRHDELDIIARNKDTLVFAEVKTRKAEDFARPAASIDDRKRHALNRAAASFLRKAHYPNLLYRFDVIEVIGEPERPAEAKVRRTENAIPFEERFQFPVC